MRVASCPWPVLGRLAGALAAALLLAAPVSAQEEAPTSDGRIQAFVEARANVTRLHGDGTALLGGAAGFHVGESWTVGGAGYVLPSAVAVGEIDFQEVEMLLGYAGILAEWRPRPGSSWFIRGVLGAGNVDVRDAATGTQLDSDNVFVVSPSAGFLLPLVGRWSVVTVAGYRVVTDVQDLRGVEGDDLRGFTLGIALRLSPL